MKINGIKIFQFHFLNMLFLFYRKISRGNDYGNDMVNITKTPLGISSKLGLLNTHRALVVAETEEKKVEDALLHLVIAKINGNTE